MGCRKPVSGFPFDGVVFGVHRLLVQLPLYPLPKRGVALEWATLELLRTLFRRVLHGGWRIFAAFNMLPTRRSNVGIKILAKGLWSRPSGIRVRSDFLPEANSVHGGLPAVLAVGSRNPGRRVIRGDVVLAPKEFVGGQDALVLFLRALLWRCNGAWLYFRPPSIAIEIQFGSVGGR